MFFPMAKINSGQGFFNSTTLRKSSFQGLISLKLNFRVKAIIHRSMHEANAQEGLAHCMYVGAELPSTHLLKLNLGSYQ